MHEGDLISDSPGFDGGSVGQGRHMIDNQTEARDQTNIDFAKLLAERLERGLREKAFDHLVLIAPPAFLGLLRHNLGKQVMARVSEQIDKNLVRQPAAEIRRHLSKLV